MTGHPLRPVTRQSLGKPSPHQQADRPRAHPPPQKLSTHHHATMCEYPVLAAVSDRYPKEGGRLLTCYSPVRHSPTPRKTPRPCVRLACVKHAASVRPEPGSNSPNKTKSRKTHHTTTTTNKQQQPHSKQSQPKNNSKTKNRHKQQTHYRVHKQHPHTHTKPKRSMREEATTTTTRPRRQKKTLPRSPEAVKSPPPLAPPLRRGGFP